MAKLLKQLWPITRPGLINEQRPVYGLENFIPEFLPQNIRLSSKLLDF
jgi:hypothetical protein